MSVMLVSLDAWSSSHREAPLIAEDPLADNVDLYAFRSPDNPDMITIIATYVPLQLPQGGPNYYSFGENIRYEIHVDNDAAVAGDEITYRFTFNQENEDPTTFFNIRLGAQNLKTTYTLERSMDGGVTFETIVQNGIVPPNNIGPRSIESPVGLGTDYATLFNSAITTSSTGETVFAGPTDDPFFVDLGGIFDLGDAPRQNGTPVDGVACYNVSALAIQVPIATLLKAGAPATPTNILDPDYVIGVWASASRPSMTTLSSTEDPSFSGEWVQVSRLGMPLTNEAVIPIGSKDFWNAITPYDEITETTLDQYFFNPELALYMDDDLFGGAVPAFSPLRVQTASLGAFDFSNGADGLFSLKGSDAVAGTALDDAVFGTLLSPGPGMPRSVDLWPAFHTGVPNVIPYQLATGKEGNPLAAGKPFVNNFLPNGGDMLRLNMAVPPTPRDDANFSSLGLVQAAAIGLTVAPFNESADLEFIPNMDGFPNGRRLEDDVTRIELQAVAGVVLAAVGLWYDDFDPMSSPSPVTQDLLDVLTYTTGVEENDKAFGGSFPYLALPADGTGDCSGELVDGGNPPPPGESIGKFFVSSNNSKLIGTFDIDENDAVSFTTTNSPANDADGIYFDQGNQLLYQLNRDNGAVYALDNFNNDMASTVRGLSAAESINGREITVSGDRIVIAQDASAANGDQNRFIVLNRNADGTSFSLQSRYDVDINLWGIQAVGETIYAVEDNSNRVAVFKNFFAPRSGSITPTFSISVEGLVRTHGLHYNQEQDLMILTDVGDAGSDTDGALVIINDWSSASSDRVIDMSEQTRIAGPSTLLGNPVDVGYNIDNSIIYVAERANGGGKVLSFASNAAAGDSAPDVNIDFAGASSIHVPNSEDGQLAEELSAVAQLFVSSNNQNKVAFIDILEDNCFAQNSFFTYTNDADGIYYNSSTDMLFQVNRMNNSILRLDGVVPAITTSGQPPYGASVGGGFTNGRELAASNGMLIVADDANDANNQTNSFFKYLNDGGNMMFVGKCVTNINLWGIHGEGDNLYAVVDNSNMIAEFDNFFVIGQNNPIPSRMISVEGLVRTHGITYDGMSDLMILTDIGDAGSDSDGGFVVIANYTAAKADGTISSSEQIRIAGPMSELGNPVDIGYDSETDMIFVAERANAGGKVLGFRRPTTSGDMTPIMSTLWQGASAIYVNSDVSNLVKHSRDIVSRMAVDNTPQNDVQINIDVDPSQLSSNLDKRVYQLSPNPANDIINVSMLSEYDGNPITVTIFNNRGQMLEEYNFSASEQSLDVSSLPQGLYYMRIVNGFDKQSMKFIKQ